MCRDALSDEDWSCGIKGWGIPNGKYMYCGPDDPYDIGDYFSITDYASGVYPPKLSVDYNGKYYGGSLPDNQFFSSTYFSFIDYGQYFSTRFLFDVSVDLISGTRKLEDNEGAGAAFIFSIDNDPISMNGTLSIAYDKYDFAGIFPIKVRNSEGYLVRADSFDDRISFWGQPGECGLEPGIGMVYADKFLTVDANGHDVLINPRTICCNNVVFQPDEEEPLSCDFFYSERDFVPEGVPVMKWGPLPDPIAVRFGLDKLPFKFVGGYQPPGPGGKPKARVGVGIKYPF